MTWLQLHIPATREKTPALERALESLGAWAITVRDGANQPLLEPAPGSTPLWQQTVISALFEGKADPEQLLALLREQLDEPLADYHIETLEDRNWERAWMDDFRPMRFGERLWIIPGGHLPPEPKAVNLYLDPGLAFGSGTHETTALCLEWLEGELLEQTSLLDYGCGSGVLAIAALLLGAKQATGCDLDSQALTATRENALANGVARQLKVLPVEELPDGQFDRVVANILAGPLVNLAGELKQRCRPGGRLALSGILAEQAESVINAYSDHFDLEPLVQRGDWVLIAGTRR